VGANLSFNRFDGVMHFTKTFLVIFIHGKFKRFLVFRHHLNKIWFLFMVSGRAESAER